MAAIEIGFLFKITFFVAVTVVPSLTGVFRGLLVSEARIEVGVSKTLSSSSKIASSDSS